MKGRIGAITSHVDLDNIVDFLATVQRKERSSAYQQTDYLRTRRRCENLSNCIDTAEKTTSSRTVNIEKWEISISGRVQVGQWFYKMTNCFGFPSEFAVIAMNYFDRVLSRSKILPTTKPEIQLIAVTCIYLSVKLHQAGPILSTEQICMISGFVFTPKQIVAMEQKILRDLDWCLYPPTPSECLEPYLQILLCHMNQPIDSYTYEILELAKEIVNDTTLDYYFVANKFLPTHIAIAALINAMITILPIPSDVIKIRDAVHVLSQCTGYTIDESDVYLCSQHLWETMNTNYEQSITESMKTFYSTPISLGNDNLCRRAASPTPKSPVGVVSYAPPIVVHCREQNFTSCEYGAIPSTNNANYWYIP